MSFFSESEDFLTQITEVLSAHGTGGNPSRLTRRTTALVEFCRRIFADSAPRLEADRGPTNPGGPLV